ncbi:MAG: hypothetical protein JST16_16030 [Bdellovibrionales bacterium]|nr:hypothetical protein [Bdellovibrionales bacterium]
MTKNWAMAVLALALAGCGDSDKAADKGVNTNDVSGLAISDGAYKVGSMTAEVTDANGQKVGPVKLEVTGSFTWTFKSIGKDSYESIGSGAAAIYQDKVEKGRLTCSVGTGVIHRFALDNGGNMTGIVNVSDSCTPGETIVLNPANTNNIKVLDKNTFMLTVIEQGNGARSVVSYTFTK